MEMVLSIEFLCAPYGTVKQPSYGVFVIILQLGTKYPLNITLLIFSILSINCPDQGGQGALLGTRTDFSCFAGYVDHPRV